MTKERQQRKQEEIRNSILDAARNIISKEGIKGLSIRKITNAIDYSPAIVYHYFRDKNDIIESLVQERFQQVMSSIMMAKTNENEPEKEIKAMFKNYIKLTLATPDLYKAFILNDDPEIVKKTTILQEGIADKSKTIGLLASQIQKGIELGRFSNLDCELTAQIIWTATFGLIMKLIVEKNIPQDQMDRLIEHNFEVLFSGIMVRETSSQ